MAFAPPMIAAMAAAIAAVGAISQGQQAKAAAQSESNAAEYNAKLADIRRRQTYAAASSQEDEQRRRARTAIGTQLATSAEAGAGLNEDLLRQSIYAAEEDTAAIRYESALKAQGFESESALQRSAAFNARQQGKAAQRAGYLKAAEKLIGGSNDYGRASRSLN